MIENEKRLISINEILGSTLMDIEVICNRARTHYVEEKDIHDILNLIRDSREEIYKLFIKKSGHNEPG